MVLELRVLKYLKKALGKGVKYNQQVDFHMNAYLDADYD